MLCKSYRQFYRLSPKRTGAVSVCSRFTVLCGSSWLFFHFVVNMLILFFTSFALVVDSSSPNTRCSFQARRPPFPPYGHVPPLQRVANTSLYTLQLLNYNSV